MTPFEIAQKQVKEGTLKTPSVSTSTGSIDYFGYQIAVHVYNLSIMSIGMQCRGITFSVIKKYYGLKGRSAKDCLPQLKQMLEDYKQSLTNKSLTPTEHQSK